MPLTRALAGTRPGDPEASEPEVLTVAELNRRVKALLEAHPGLRGLHVHGEASNCYRAPSGHIYFTLKQDGAEVRCVMWRSFAEHCPPEFENGLQVLIEADVALYEDRGQYQLLVRRIEPAGEGLLWLKLAALRKRLEAEGLFDSRRKRALPRIPRRIGVVTSRTGAAFQDILHVLGRRAPYLEVVLVDARVQGKEAVPSIVAALRRIAQADVDVVIVGRGGGSLEDLWAFNEEAVVRAIAACPVPTISAVGHETDTSLSDFVADMRCPTPSAAAETVAPAIDDLLQRLDHAEHRMARTLQGRLDVARQRLEGVAKRPLFARPDALLEPMRRRIEDVNRRMPRALLVKIEQTRSRLDEQGRRLPAAMQNELKTKDQGVRRAAGMLDALSPLKVLARGYAVPLKEGKAVQSVRGVRRGDRIDLRVVDGTITTEVKEVDEDTEDGS